jgi:hypothetical protein
MAINAPTDFPTFVGNAYAHWTLDVLIELGYAIAVDFANRPQLYKANNIPDNIVDFRMSYGTAAEFPNTVQRQTIMTPPFGRSDGLKPDATTASWPFQMARKKLIDACTAFSERAVDTGIPMLEESVRSALVSLTNHLQTLQGKSFSLSGGQIQQEMNVAVLILLSGGVDTVFGIGVAVDGDWPFASSDPNGALLVENAGLTLSVTGDYKLNHSKFVTLQRAAQEGAKALQLVLTTDPAVEAQLLALITQCYTWGKSLRDFQLA